MKNEKNNNQKKKSNSLVKEKKGKKSQKEQKNRGKSLNEIKRGKSKSTRRGKSEKNRRNHKTVKSKEKKLEKSMSKEKIKKNNITSQEKNNKDKISENILFENNDLYSLLGLKRNATNYEIRKAYKKLVLLCHPDKNKNDPDTASKFMNITRAYKILSNYNSRKYYDETGEYEEEEQGRIDVGGTLDFFRKIYSPQDIESYVDKYIGSKEEEQDLIQFYNENDGDLTRILECIPCSKNEDIERFIDIYEKLFKKKILKKNDKYDKTKDNIKLIKELEDEKEEAEKIYDKLTKQIMINKKKRNYNDYLKELANKYGEGDNNIEENNEISEEEFKKISNKLNKGKKGKNKRK